MSCIRQYSDGHARLHPKGDLLDMRVQLSRAGLAVFLSSSRAKRLSVRPLRPAVLVAVELLGVAAEVASEGLQSRHGDFATWFGEGGYIYVSWLVGVVLTESVVCIDDGEVGCGR